MIFLVLSNECMCSVLKQVCGVAVLLNESEAHKSPEPLEDLSNSTHHYDERALFRTDTCLANTKLSIVG